MRRRRGFWLLMAMASLLGTLGLAAVAVCLTTGCSTLGYYAQATGGHLDLLQRARPVAQAVADPATPPALRQRLELSQRLRDFAVTELKLPDNSSYRRYADLQREAVVWNVVAAPELGLKLKTWCFPVLGCVGYRGYFQREPADALAAQLKAEGWEVMVYGVPAYSTLGFSNWVGGDPLLNTFIQWPEAELARLLFHELAHQVVYAEGDTLFNESFATAVERIGIAQWLATHASEQARAAAATSEARRSAFRTLTRATRARLGEIFDLKQAVTPDAIKIDAMKSVAMQSFRAEYAALRERWLRPQDGTAPLASTAQVAGYDRWVARANNASFAAQAAYDDLVPAFEALHAREGGDWQRFYDAVRQLARQPQPARHAALRALLPR